MSDIYFFLVIAVDVLEYPYSLTLFLIFSFVFKIPLASYTDFGPLLLTVCDMIHILCTLTPVFN